MINREIRDLQPDFYSDVYEYDQLAKVEEKSINETDEYLLKQLHNIYVSKSDKQGIEMKEKAYGITPNEYDDLETRRRRIVSKLLPPQAITVTFFKRMLSSLNLDVESDIDCINSVYNAIVDFDNFNNDQINELNSIIDMYLPANLAKKIYRYQQAKSNLGSYMGVANTIVFYSHADYKGE